MSAKLFGDKYCYQLVQVPDSGTHTLSSLAEANGIGCARGEGFYMLGKKKENVSEKKEMVLVERADDVFEEEDAIDDFDKVRQELGIGNAKASINETVTDDFYVFVQSTSANRKLMPGAFVVYRGEAVEVGMKRNRGKTTDAPHPKKHAARAEAEDIPSEIWQGVATHLDSKTVRSLAGTSQKLKGAAESASISFVRNWIDAQKKALPSDHCGEEDFFERVAGAGHSIEKVASELHSFLEAYEGKSWYAMPGVEPDGDEATSPYFTTIHIHVEEDSLLKWPKSFRWDSKRPYPNYPLRAIDQALSIECSKVGGLPHLPRDGSIQYNGEFYGQYNCADLAPYDLRCIWPATGMVYFFASGMYYYAGSKDQLVPTAPDDAEETIVCPVQPIEFRLTKQKKWGWSEKCDGCVHGQAQMMNTPSTDSELFIEGPDDAYELEDPEEIIEWVSLFSIGGDEWSKGCWGSTHYAKWSTLKAHKWDKVIVSVEED